MCNPHAYHLILPPVPCAQLISLLLSLSSLILHPTRGRVGVVQSHAKVEKQHPCRRMEWHVLPATAKPPELKLNQGIMLKLKGTEILCAEIPVSSQCFFLYKYKK